MGRVSVLLGLSALLTLGGTSSAQNAVGVPTDPEAFDPAREESWQLPEPDLYAVDARSSLAWASGYWGTVLVSQDAGATWTAGDTPTREILYDIDFSDDQHGWAVGANGVILYSGDGGLTWTQQEALVEDEFGDRVPVDAHLFGISSLSSSEAWTVGDLGLVLHTTDAGATWEQIVIGPESLADENFPERIFNAVHFSDPQTGWIVGEFGTTLRTLDGGATWVGERELANATEDLYLFDLAVSASGEAAVVGLAGSVLVSTDMGSTWEMRSAPTSAGLFGLGSANTSITVAGDRGEVYVSQDAGGSWSPAKRPRIFNWLRGVAYANGRRAYVVGEKGVILRSEDGGRTFTQVLGQRPAVIPVTTPGPPPEQRTPEGIESRATAAPEP